MESEKKDMYTAELKSGECVAASKGGPTLHPQEQATATDMGGCMPSAGDACSERKVATYKTGIVLSGVDTGGVVALPVPV